MCAVDVKRCAEAELAPLEVLTRDVAQALRDGELSLGQAVNLTAREQRAVRREARESARRGQLNLAIAYLALLLTCEPLGASDWHLMGELQQRVNNPASALACYEAARTLGEESPNLMRRQARCLQQLGEDELARELLGEHA